MFVLVYVHIYVIGHVFTCMCAMRVWERVCAVCVYACVPVTCAFM